MSAACPLCGGEAAPFHRSDRDFLRCGTCALTFVPPEQHLSPEAEGARYATHRNSPEDAGYRAFLDRVLAPLAARLAPGARGLDFGSGPGPTASVMMRERGFHMSDWDPHFAPDEAPLRGTYGFVTCTEVAEHLRRPAQAFARIDSLLEPGGVLGVLTGVLEDDAAFPSWWYHKDPTHVAFYRPETLAWLARRFGWTLERPSRDAAIFVKRKDERGVTLVEVCVSVLLVALMSAPIMSTVLTSSMSSRRSERRMSAAAAVRGVSEHLKGFVTADRTLARGPGDGPDGWHLPGDRSALWALEAGRHELDAARWAPGLADAGGAIAYEVTVRPTPSGPEPSVAFTVSWSDQ